ncbi:hypothetical protein CHARACLAT_033370 [Characodon lateralis]|uniref:Uncharacterized protein n=1 Tax=Characodon lateralis TaxID=208331 RepID=A0ABU7DCN3_9TELE|nr:hypothetical protein [Characodon lateralis]
MRNFRFLPTTNKPKKKKSHVKKMRPARRRCRGSQCRGTLYNLFDSKITCQINNIQILSREESEATEASAFDQDDREPEEPVPGYTTDSFPAMSSTAFAPPKGPSGNSA